MTTKLVCAHNNILLNPSKLFGLLIDRSRILRNKTGQLIYKDTNLRIRPQDVVLPSVYSSSARVQTAGIINYLVNHILNYVFSNNLKSYSKYAEDETSKKSRCHGHEYDHAPRTHCSAELGKYTRV